MNRSAALAFALALLLASAPAFADGATVAEDAIPTVGRPAPVGTVSFGLTLEGRPLGMTAATATAGYALDGVRLDLRSAATMDLAVLNLAGEPGFGRSWLSPRSMLLEAGTGAAGPLGLSVRAQADRFGGTGAVQYSLFPYAWLDTRFFFLDLGANFRRFSMRSTVDEGERFIHTEKQFSFRIGGRAHFGQTVSATLCVSNFDEYLAGSFATIGIRGDFSVERGPRTWNLSLGWQPSGMMALAATPQGWLARLVLEHTL